MHTPNIQMHVLPCMPTHTCVTCSAPLHVSPHYSQVSIHPGKKSDASCVCHCFVVLVVCVCVYTCACMCACVCLTDINISFPPQLFSAQYFWRARSLIELGVHWDGWPGNPGVLLPPPFPRWDYRHTLLFWAGRSSSSNSNHVTDGA